LKNWANIPRSIKTNKITKGIQKIFPENFVLSDGIKNICIKIAKIAIEQVSAKINNIA